MNRFRTSDGLSLAFMDEGEGLPVLCLPGLTRNGQDFRFVAERFRDSVRVIRLDFRGRGASDHDPEFSNYNVAVEARDVVELLDHLGLEKAVILGTSRGGLVAMTLAATARDRLMGVILNDVGPVIAQEGLAAIMLYLGQKPSYRTLDEAGVDYAARMAPMFPGVSADRWRWYLGNTWRETADGLELRYDVRMRDAFETALAAGALPDLWPVFDMFEGLPLAVIRGENSNILSQDTMEEMITRRPDMMAVTVPDRGHIPFLDEPEAVGLLDRFFQGFAQ